MLGDAGHLEVALQIASTAAQRWSSRNAHDTAHQNNSSMTHIGQITVSAQARVAKGGVRDLEAELLVRNMTARANLGLQ